MAYCSDPDLKFLSNLTAKDLAPLVHVLVYDKYNEIRYTEEITSNEKYKQFNSKSQ